MTLDLLRFTTAGSVDDGKSTLIGRLLYDTKQVFEDQLEHVAQASERRGGEGALDLALLTDGLRAEREQGITIDVAYRYFATAKRRFIIADCPGHQQYTRNMVTGASTADLSVILLDARKGVLEQSKRHAFISALLGIPHLVVAVNKMDLVEHSHERFEELVREFESFTHRLAMHGGAGATGIEEAGGASGSSASESDTTGGSANGDSANGSGPSAVSARRRDITYIPMSALNGDNVVERSEQMPWYEGPTLLEFLENVEVAYDHPDDTPARFPVQWVIRPSAGSGEGGDYRGYAGQLASGALRPGDEVTALPSGGRTRIAAIDTLDGELSEALAPMSVTLLLEDELDISRGELICRAEHAPTVARELEADVCWMSEQPLRAGGRYLIKHTARHAEAIVDGLCDAVDVHTLERSPEPPSELALNDIGRIRLRLRNPLVFDPYAANRRTGSFILIDEASNETVGAGMITAAAQ
ncbi:MAG TPA: GTP-binding protein [Solirubrobacteraceae bacterium]|jgi:small GTP-binding protein